MSLDYKAGRDLKGLSAEAIKAGELKLEGALGGVSFSMDALHDSCAPRPRHELCPVPARGGASINSALSNGYGRGEQATVANLIIIDVISALFRIVGHCAWIACALVPLCGL